MSRYIVYICAFLYLFSHFYQVHGITGLRFDDFYESSDRLGCESVQSQTICPATELNPDLALDYETDAEMVNIMIDDVKMDNASQECLTALQTTYCSTITPRCFVNGSKDYGDARSACWKAITTCPSNSLEEKLCKTLNVGMQHLSACVLPSTPINGTCPQPKFKMPKDKLDLYTRSSIEYENIGYFDDLVTLTFPNRTRMISDECVSKIKELHCLPFYCSADEQKIVVEYTYGQCEDILDTCFRAMDVLGAGRLKNKTEELRERYAENCVFYPEIIDGSEIPLENNTTPTFNRNVSTTLQQRGSPTPPGSNASTTPQQTASPTPPGNNASTTPQETVSLAPAGNNASTTPQQKASTTAPEKNRSTTPTQEIPSTPSDKNMSTTPEQIQPSTTLLDNSTSTTPGQNMSSKRPDVTTSLPKDTKKPSSPTTELFETPSPTAGSERCQNFLNLIFLFFLFVSIQINV